VGRSEGRGPRWAPDGASGPLTTHAPWESSGAPGYGVKRNPWVSLCVEWVPLLSKLSQARQVAITPARKRASQAAQSTLALSHRYRAERRWGMAPQSPDRMSPGVTPLALAPRLQQRSSAHARL
jgi:hypothetical protein